MNSARSPPWLREWWPACQIPINPLQSLNIAESYPSFQNQVSSQTLTLPATPFSHPTALLHETSSVPPAKPATQSASQACCAPASLQVHCMHFMQSHFRRTSNVHLPGFQCCHSLSCVPTLAQHAKIHGQALHSSRFNISQIFISWFTVPCR